MLIWVLTTWVLSTVPVQAANQEIRALFQPDPAQPSKNVFINKTPNSGYCASFPGECAQNQVFSIQLPIRFSSTRALYQGEVVPIKVPANWRQLMVTNRETQQTEVVEVRITGIGSKFVLSEPARELVGVSSDLEGHQKLWTSNSWVYAPAPCRYSGVGVFSATTYRFFWKTPLEASCIKRNAYPIPSIYFDTIDFAYELRTPDPLGMASGLYTGSLAYSLGSGGDFDLGPLMQPDDSSLTLDFVLDVQHTLKVDLPPGGNKVSLEPEGGWKPWIDSGRKPARIYRDQAFYLSSSSRFRVMMMCDAPVGGKGCTLRSPSGDSTEVEVLLTLPPGITGPAGGDVKALALRHYFWFGPFQPQQYVDRKAGSLRFEIPRAAIDTLLRPGKNDRLTGNITIIWDSDV
ncbi:hypothetical protein GXB78_08540 [Pseudomonas moraviensis subsp. stanleyae]|uniref:hypothetical protein n=1 Tax=Pseudomonas moraviensis TaxID=321662 RepID=UPI002E5F6411|nr:hypothetical protein [Pseudomonas moraviensis subsp. stanleyae]